MKFTGLETHLIMFIFILQLFYVRANTGFFRVENVSVGPWEVLGPGHHAPNLTGPHMIPPLKVSWFQPTPVREGNGRQLSLNHNNALS